MLIKNLHTKIEDESYRIGRREDIRDRNGRWVNTEPFRKASMDFIKYGYYCPDPKGSPLYDSFWTEERRRCRNGYSVEGISITGDFYYYLNYYPIQKAIEDTYIKGKGKKITGFPDFWDGDFNYFWCREIARNGVINKLLTSEEHIRNISSMSEEDMIKEARIILEDLQLKVIVDDDSLLGGHDLCVGKSRRKGYSYKSGAIACNNFFNKPNTLTIFAAYDNGFLLGKKGIFSKAYDGINFVNEYTAWASPSDVSNQPAKGNIRNSYVVYKNGIQIEKGFKSEIKCVTCKDNPDAIRGADIYDVFFEESGAFGTPGLLEQTFISTVDASTAGSLKTGMNTVFGTSGDMEGGTYDYAMMFKRPKVFGFLSIKNKYKDPSCESCVGFFHPDNWNMEGFMDSVGNSMEEEAKNAELAVRNTKINNGATTIQINKRMQEHPLNPEEAFAAISSNTYPVVELQNTLDRNISLDLDNVKGTCVILSREGDKVIARRDLSGKAMPIKSYHTLPEDVRGCLVVYEEPIPDAPRGLYKIGYDPIRQDKGTSLAAVTVRRAYSPAYRRPPFLSAYWLGRYEAAEDNDRMVELISDYFNSPIMYENEVTSVKNYFRKIKRLGILCVQPDAVISKNIMHSRVSRVYGCHMNDQLKDAGERYIKDALLDITDYDENGVPIHGYDTIYSQRLLEELIEYNRKGNFDLHSALIMSLIQEQQDYLEDHVEETHASKVQKKLMQLIPEMYRK